MKQKAGVTCELGAGTLQRGGSPEVEDEIIVHGDHHDPFTLPSLGSLGAFAYC